MCDVAPRHPSSTAVHGCTKALDQSHRQPDWRGASCERGSLVALRRRLSPGLRFIADVGGPGGRCESAVQQGDEFRDRRVTLRSRNIRECAPLVRTLSRMLSALDRSPRHARHRRVPALGSGMSVATLSRMRRKHWTCERAFPHDARDSCVDVLEASGKMNCLKEAEEDEHVQHQVRAAPDADRVRKPRRQVRMYRESDAHQHDRRKDDSIA